MRTQPPLGFIVAGLAFLSAAGLADTITLKSGEKVQGRISAETDSEITIVEKVSATITDTRTVRKADVEKVEKESPDAAAWEAIKAFQPGANSMPAAANYDALITPLKDFVTRFGSSPNAAEAQKRLAAIEEEKKRVEAGEVKFEEKWLSKEEAEKERYQLNAALTFNFMKDQAARNDPIAALNTFAVLEKQYPGARVYPDAAEVAKALLARLKTEVDRHVQKLPALKAEEAKAIEFAAEPRKSELKAALQNEQTKADAAVQQAERQGLKWPPLHNRSQKSLTALSGKIPAELQRLTALPVANMRKSVETAEQARASLAANDLVAAEAAVRQAQSLWNVNELATRLQKEITTARAAAAAAAREVKAATPAPATPAPTPDPAVVAARAAARQAAEAEKAEAEKPFLLTPAGAIVVIVVGIGIFAAVRAYRSVKSRANDILE